MKLQLNQKQLNEMIADILGQEYQESSEVTLEAMVERLSSESGNEYVLDRSEFLKLLNDAFLAEKYHKTHFLNIKGNSQQQHLKKSLILNLAERLNLTRHKELSVEDEWLSILEGLSSDFSLVGLEASVHRLFQKHLGWDISKVFLASAKYLSNDVEQMDLQIETIVSRAIKYLQQNRGIQKEVYTRYADSKNYDYSYKQFLMDIQDLKKQVNNNGIIDLNQFQNLKSVSNLFKVLSFDSNRIIQNEVKEAAYLLQLGRYQERQNKFIGNPKNIPAEIDGKDKESTIQFLETLGWNISEEQAEQVWKVWQQYWNQDEITVDDLVMDFDKVIADYDLNLLTFLSVGYERVRLRDITLGLIALVLKEKKAAIYCSHTLHERIRDIANHKDLAIIKFIFFLRMPDDPQVSIDEINKISESIGYEDISYAEANLIQDYYLSGLNKGAFTNEELAAIDEALREKSHGGFETFRGHKNRVVMGRHGFDTRGRILSDDTVSQVDTYTLHGEKSVGTPKSRPENHPGGIPFPQKWLEALKDLRKDTTNKSDLTLIDQTADWKLPEADVVHFYQPETVYEKWYKPGHALAISKIKIAKEYLVSGAQNIAVARIPLGEFQDFRTSFYQQIAQATIAEDYKEHMSLKEDILLYLQKQLPSVLSQIDGLSYDGILQELFNNRSVNNYGVALDVLIKHTRNGYENWLRNIMEGLVAANVLFQHHRIFNKAGFDLSEDYFIFYYVFQKAVNALNGVDSTYSKDLKKFFQRQIKTLNLQYKTKTGNVPPKLKLKAIHELPREWIFGLDILPDDISLDSKPLSPSDKRMPTEDEWMNLYKSSDEIFYPVDEESIRYNVNLRYDTINNADGLVSRFAFGAPARMALGIQKLFGIKKERSHIMTMAVGASYVYDVLAAGVEGYFEKFKSIFTKKDPQIEISNILQRRGRRILRSTGAKVLVDQESIKNEQDMLILSEKYNRQVLWGIVHTGIGDIPFGFFVNGKSRMVARRIMGAMPPNRFIFNAANMTLVDRPSEKNKSKIEKAMNRALPLWQRLKGMEENVNLLETDFPSGTRSRVGGVGTLRHGQVRMALKNLKAGFKRSDIPLIFVSAPVGLDNVVPGHFAKLKKGALVDTAIIRKSSNYLDPLDFYNQYVEEKFDGREPQTGKEWKDLRSYLVKKITLVEYQMQTSLMLNALRNLRFSFQDKNTPEYLKKVSRNTYEEFILRFRDAFSYLNSNQFLPEDTDFTSMVVTVKGKNLIKNLRYVLNGYEGPVNRDVLEWCYHNKVGYDFVVQLFNFVRTASSDLPKNWNVSKNIIRFSEPSDIYIKDLNRILYRDKIEKSYQNLKLSSIESPCDLDSLSIVQSYMRPYHYKQYRGKLGKAFEKYIDLFSEGFLYYKSNNQKELSAWLENNNVDKEYFFNVLLEHILPEEINESIIRFKKKKSSKLMMYGINVLKFIFAEKASWFMKKKYFLDDNPATQLVETHLKLQPLSFREIKDMMASISNSERFTSLPTELAEAIEMNYGFSEPIWQEMKSYALDYLNANLDFLSEFSRLESQKSKSVEEKLKTLENKYLKKIKTLTYNGKQMNSEVISMMLGIDDSSYLILPSSETDKEFQNILDLEFKLKEANELGVSKDKLNNIRNQIGKAYDIYFKKLGVALSSATYLMLPLFGSSIAKSDFLEIVDHLVNVSDELKEKLIFAYHRINSPIVLPYEKDELSVKNRKIHRKVELRRREEEFSSTFREVLDIPGVARNIQKQLIEIYYSREVCLKSISIFTKFFNSYYYNGSGKREKDELRLSYYIFEYERLLEKFDEAKRKNQFEKFKMQYLKAQSRLEKSIYDYLFTKSGLKFLKYFRDQFYSEMEETNLSSIVNNHHEYWKVKKEIFEQKFLEKKKRRVNEQEFLNRKSVKLDEFVERETRIQINAAKELMKLVHQMIELNDIKPHDKLKKVLNEYEKLLVRFQSIEDQYLIEAKKQQEFNESLVNENIPEQPKFSKGQKVFYNRALEIHGLSGIDLYNLAAKAYQIATKSDEILEPISFVRTAINEKRKPKSSGEKLQNITNIASYMGKHLYPKLLEAIWIVQNDLPTDYVNKVILRWAKGISENFHLVEVEDRRTGDLNSRRLLDSSHNGGWYLDYTTSEFISPNGKRYVIMAKANLDNLIPDPMGSGIKYVANSLPNTSSQLEIEKVILKTLLYGQHKKLPTGSLLLMGGQNTALYGSLTMGQLNRFDPHSAIDPSLLLNDFWVTGIDLRGVGRSPSLLAAYTAITGSLANVKLDVAQIVGGMGVGPKPDKDVVINKRRALVSVMDMDILNWMSFENLLDDNIDAKQLLWMIRQNAQSDIQWEREKLFYENSMRKIADDSVFEIEDSDDSDADDIKRILRRNKETFGLLNNPKIDHDHMVDTFKKSGGSHLEVIRQARNKVGVIPVKTGLNSFSNFNLMHNSTIGMKRF